MTETDIAVIGAGLAGLGAATALRAAGRRAIVLEAAPRAGGRAHTIHPPELGGAWFDTGAVWLHNAETNPLVPIARAAGETLLRSDDLRQERTYVGDRPATEAELAAYAGAWDRFAAAADRLLTPGNPDPALSAVAHSIPDDPWALTVEAWEGPVICAVDADRFSLRDWHVNQLTGSNLVPACGIGAFVASRLTPGLDIRHDTPVRAISWDRPGGAVAIETDRGTITARAAIVTVSTGVLAAGAIRFDPELPTATRDAIAALPMGLAMKVALRAAGPDRLDLPGHTSLDRQARQSGEPFMVFQCWPFGRDYVQGWIGGGPAAELARAGAAAAGDFARAALRAMFGSRIDALFPAPAFVTRWDADPLVRGAYAYAVPGAAGARARLGEPLADGRLIFAGEACHVGLAGTLAGAWLSGRAAAGLARP